MGYLSTYITPLGFVVSLTMFKEAYDDFRRYQRDKDANKTIYKLLAGGGLVDIKSRDLKVG